MRNLFDQYDAPENRLTHALACCLHHDSGLLRSFVPWSLGSRPPAGSRLKVAEQQVPGELEVFQEAHLEPGLPDAWIHNDEDWALIIESKVKSPVKAAQLKRHRQTAKRAGFHAVHVLVLSVDRPTPRALAGAAHRTWSEVYAWFLKRRDKSLWAGLMADYMESAERRMVEEDYLQEGTLTMFDGIRFGNENPYNYREAKRLLRLALNKLRAYKALHRLGMDPMAPGRPAITGRDRSSVWDFLRLKPGASTAFTKYPHLTLSITRERVEVMITIPHRIKSACRHNLVALGFEQFRDLLHSVQRRLSGALRKAKGFQPSMYAVQRRYRSPSAAPFIDARLEFDLRTTAPSHGRRSRGALAVKRQPEWLKAAYDALANKRSNLQLGVGAYFPYGCGILRSSRATDYFAATWLACEPILTTLFRGQVRGTRKRYGS